MGREVRRLDEKKRGPRSVSFAYDDVESSSSLSLLSPLLLLGWHPIFSLRSSSPPLPSLLDSCLSLFSFSTLFLSPLTIGSRSRDRDGRGAGPHGRRGPYRDWSRGMMEVRSTTRRRRRRSKGRAFGAKLLLLHLHLLLLRSSTSSSVRFEHGLEATGGGRHARFYLARRKREETGGRLFFFFFEQREDFSFVASSLSLTSLLCSSLSRTPTHVPPILAREEGSARARWRADWQRSRNGEEKERERERGGEAISLFLSTSCC